MDKLGNQLSNVSLYDVKAYVRKAQNAVLNFSEMESKVREATNNEPWGASTSVMQTIAQGTFNHQQFHEIMPFIYRRFTEKTASEWRQIYKALQLLEFLIKNGAERVVDYARSHTAVIDMLRNFHYIDSKNRDQGINIRNRAEQLLELLGSVERIRDERKKSKQLNQKTGISAAVSSDPTASRASRYTPREPRGVGSSSGGGGGGAGAAPQFGSGAYTQRVYGDGGFNGSFAEQRVDEDDDFAEYEVGPTTGGATSSQAAAAPAASASAPVTEDDEFDDFQSAPSAPAAAAPQTNASILDLFSSTPAVHNGAAAAAAAPIDNLGSNAFVQTPSATYSAPAAASYTAPASTTAAAAPAAPKPDAFGSLWQTSKNSPKPVTPVSKPVATPAPAAQSEPQTSQASTTAEVDDLLLF